MQGIRIIEIPACRMVASPVGMFGDGALEAFMAWMDKQPRSIFPRDFLSWDAARQGFRWLYLYEDGMEVPVALDILPFQGGLYAVATDIDQQTDKSAMTAEVEAFCTQNGLVRDPDRPELGNIITTPAARAILGYEQMDYYYPVKGR